MIRALRVGPVFVFIVGALTAVGLTASNAVAPSRLGTATSTFTAAQAAPTECQGLPPAAIFSGAGTVNATGADELVLGSAGVDSIRAGAGDDCVLGGGGDDSLRGDQGTDVCIGGPGADSFHPSCETTIQ